ncbi:MAG: hypothetical protein KIT79_12565 [Deltaproteobacteria bacterium]|nr:hypothetical protein [Deltaproteobacteria bacterium]
MGVFADPAPADRYAAFEADVPKIETSDLVQGGDETAPSNKTGRGLNRRVTAVAQQLSDLIGADVRDSSVRAHARKAAELYRLFGNRMFAGSDVTSPAPNTVRLPSSCRILVNGYWYEPSADRDKSDLPESNSGGLYLHFSGFDPETNRPVFELVTAGADGVAEFAWTNGVRSVADPTRFFLCNWATNGIGTVTVTFPAKPLADSDLALPVGMPVPWIRKGSADALPSNWIALTGGTVSQPRSPFHGLAVPDLTNRFVRGAAASAEVASTPSGGSDTHSHTTGTNPTTASPGNEVIENNTSVVGGGAINNHLTAHTHSVSTANHVPAYRGFQYAMRIY